MMHHLQLTFFLTISLASKQYKVSIAPDKLVMAKNEFKWSQSPMTHIIAWGNVIGMQTLGWQPSTSQLWEKHKFKSYCSKLGTQSLSKELIEVTECNLEETFETSVTRSKSWF